MSSTFLLQIYKDVLNQRRLSVNSVDKLEEEAKLISVEFEE